MTTKPETNDDDSFIILGTSPGSSLDIKCNGVENNEGLLCDNQQLEEALIDVPVLVNMAFKSHFSDAEEPSPTSMMAASTIITDDKTTEELQKRFGEILDENLILKETLKKNNASMRKQFMLIASCQEDMLKTHLHHSEKFNETRDLVEKLRQENKQLKQDVVKLFEKHTPSVVNNEPKEALKSGPPSAMEFVTSPDDDTINKLTAQLELVEKQRRQVIVENERLTWQKESLEHIVDATSKERDDLKEKLKNAELQLSSKDAEYSAKIDKLKCNIHELNTQLQTASLIPSIPASELATRDMTINQLEAKLAMSRAELKNAKLTIFELEGVKIEFMKHKCGASESVKIYKDQIQELHGRLKEASTTVFQPVRFSLSSEPETSLSEYSELTSNVKLYDRTLKHLAELLNKLTHGMSDSLVETLGLVASLHEYKLENATIEQFKSGLAEVKQQLEMQHSTTLHNIGQVRGTLSIFEGIFKDYNELLKKSLTKQKLERPSSAANVEALTAALVARGQELQLLETELNKLRNEKEDGELMKAQLDLYKSDFEAERESREKMASEKENILTDLRTTKRQNKELTQQLEELRKINPSVYRTVTSSPRSTAPTTPRRPSNSEPYSTAGKMTYTCPKCMRYSCDQYKLMEDHFDFCLDDF